MNRREFCKTAASASMTWKVLSGLGMFSLASMAKAAGSHAIATGKPVAGKFVLDNILNHPFYFWPRTLLVYDVNADGPLTQEQFELVCNETGQTIPWQLLGEKRKDSGQNWKGRFAFFSDLPAGEDRTFELRRRSTDAPVATKPARVVAIAEEGNSITIHTGPMQVRIPASQQVSGAAPGPLMQVRRGEKWVGKSTLAFDSRRVVKITTTCLNRGPLLVRYALAYELEGGGEYKAAIECMEGMDFIRFQEDMEGLPADVHGVFEFNWEGVRFAQRQMPDHPRLFPTKYEAGHRYEYYGWERVDEPQINTHLGVIPGIDANGDLNYSIGVYQPWPVWTVGSFASFWDPVAMDAAAIFIDRAEQWHDPDYPIWHSSPRLHVRFRSKSGSFAWRWPLERGSRSTCVAFYDHTKDIEQMRCLEQFNQKIRWKDGAEYSTSLFPTSYGHYLQNRFGTIDLDKVKEWELRYEASQPHPAPSFPLHTAHNEQAFVTQLQRSGLTCQLPLSGTRQNGSFSPVPGREILDSWVNNFNELYPTMTSEQKQHATAVFLLQAYMCAGEDYMPMIPLLSGHPNFLSDVKSTPAAAAYLFPNHPQADAWVQEFEKYMELNTHCHTRPAVKAWDAHGGRWTENIGTYVWGFLRPVVQVHYLLKQTRRADGMVTPQLAQMADWLVNALTAPFNGENPDFVARVKSNYDAHNWGIIFPGETPSRLHPPIGAHSERRRPPRMMWYLGTMLQNYAPLVAEHAMWAARAGGPEMEKRPETPDVRGVMYRGHDNLGTNPHLRSSKYTGYGITMRAAVDTAQEVSVHLQQIDDGPNYRWGVAGEGGCGVLYFFAGGKGYSHNASEDEGDRDASDTDFVTNFGVWKDGYFRSIGQNVLSRPMYDLGCAQFAEIVPRTGARTYSAPEYLSRSVLLAGADYFMLYDHVFNESVAHRLSWFVRRGDEFPKITLLRGAKASGTGAIFPPTKIETDATVGKWFDGAGDSMACVTHRDGIVATATEFGARVRTPESEDLVFMNPGGSKFAEQGIRFEGTSGIVRKHAQKIELALFHGRFIGARDLTFHVSNTDIGVAAVFAEDGKIAGIIYAAEAGSIEVECAAQNTKAQFYLNGGEVVGARSGNVLRIEVAKGTFAWELSEGAPVPIAPEITRTENRGGGARVIVTSVPSATHYRLELSEDGGATWKNAAQSDSSEIALAGLANDRKYHVRATALNSKQTSVPGPEYPLYVTDRPPAPPAGFAMKLGDGSATVRWGEVLGVTEYRLYRRTKGQEKFVQVYLGLKREFVDRNPALRKPDLAPCTGTEAAERTIFEYRVAAANSNGEGQPSMTIDSDTGSWRNWNPLGDEPFRRAIVASRFVPEPNDGAGFHYPQ